jgi:hypothetical protein
MASASQTGRRITTHEATVKTATVEIKTLSVSGKQVTQALFRQLKEEALIDAETQTFRGLPWGTVNYCPSRACAEIREHVHVVWQVGIELRRGTVARRGAWGLKQYQTREHEARELMEFCAIALAQRTEPRINGIPISDPRSSRPSTYCFVLPGFAELEALNWPASDIAALWQARKRDPRQSSAQPLFLAQRIEQLGAEIADCYDEESRQWQLHLRSERDLPPDLLALTSDQLKEVRSARGTLQGLLLREKDVADHLAKWRGRILVGFGYEVVALEDAMTHLERALNTMTRIRSEWSKRYDELLALDQLFIAV